MITLYIDTHNEKLVLALARDNSLVAKKELESNLHSKNTIPLLEELLKDNNLEIKDINEILVVIGPGSFTGVRIGVVIAKLIGYTKNIVVKPISFLEVISLKYKEKVVLGIKDRNGAYLAGFENNQMIENYRYLSNQQLLEEENVIYDDEVDFNKLFDFSASIKAVNPHELKPLYVKKIEALK